MTAQRGGRGRFVDTAPDTTTTRYCPECKDYLPFSEFYADARAKSGLTRRCRTHHSRMSYEARLVRETPSQRYEYTRERQLRTKYGMTVAQYDEMLAAQNGVCAICEGTESSHYGLLHVDHDHETGKVRALLCSQCNTGVGKFRDNPALLRLAAEYVEAHRAGVSVLRSPF